MSNEELVVRIQAGEQELMGELWKQVAGLVKWKANRIMSALDLRGNPCGVEYDDLCQCGYLALVTAVETYTLENGSFSNWFMFYLKTSFAEATGYRTQAGKNEPLNNAFSLNKTIDGEADGASFGDFVADPSGTATLEAIEEREYRKQLHEALETALEALPERSADVLRLRHYQRLTLADIGEIHRTTPENIRQIENKALRQLRKPSIACHLRPFYEFDFYNGTGLSAFRSRGISIQELYLMIMEGREKRKARMQREELERKLEKLASARIERENKQRTISMVRKEED